MSRLQRTLIALRESFRDPESNEEPKELKWAEITYGKVLEMLRENKFEDSEVLLGARDWVISRIAYGTALQLEVGSPEPDPEGMTEASSGAQELQALVDLYKDLRDLVEKLYDEEKEKGDSRCRMKV